MSNLTEQDILLPLTDAQKQLWILAQLEPQKSIFYNYSISLQMRGSLEIAAMKRAMQKVVGRHEALRTRILANGEQQQIIPVLEVEIPVVNFSQTDTNSPIVEALNWFEQENNTIFELNQELPWRWQIIKLEEELHWLVLTTHQIGLDFHSMVLIFNELASLYTTERREEICQLPTPKQFRDYINWQIEQSQTQRGADSEAYWLEKLAGELPVLNLPTDTSVVGNKFLQIKTEILELDEQLVDNLKIFSQVNNCSVFALLLGVYFVLLHRLAQQPDIIVGVPTSGRYFDGSQELVGSCADLSIIRSILSKNYIFSDYLKQIENFWLEAQQYHYPFSKLSDKLRSQNSQKNSLLVTTMFSWEQMISVPQMWGLETDLFPLGKNFQDYDLSWQIVETNQKLAVKASYSNHLFTSETIKRWLGHFQTLIKAILENPQQNINELPLLTTKEAHQLLVEWNQTRSDYSFEKCIHELFAEQVQMTPNNVAVVLGDKQLTYTELNERANQLANYLHFLGVEPEILVGICVERSWEMIVGILGILKAGGAYVPLDPSYPQERLAYMLDNSRLKVLLTKEKLLDSIPENQAQLVCLDRDWPEIEKYNYQNQIDNVNRVRPHNLAYVIYTSGTTGQPKGVLSTHYGLCNLALCLQKAFYVKSQSRILQIASLSFDASVAEIFITLISGATLVMGTSDTLLIGDNLLRLMKENSVTHAIIGPAALAVLPPTQLPSLEVLILAGEALSHEIAKKWSSGRHLFNAYGPSEGTVCATLTEIQDFNQKPPIGRPIANVQVYILDSNLQPVPVGIPGELHIGGVGLARGYLNREELTSTKFIANPFSIDRGDRLYKTGDLVRYLPDGNIEFIGRIDNQVKIRGYRIELGEITELLRLHPEVQDAVVIHREYHPGDKRLVAYIVAKDNRNLNTELVNMIGEYLRKHLPEYMIPSALLVLPSLPLTPNGKIDHKSLPAPDLSTIFNVNYVSPNSQIEKIIAEIWQDVLQIERVGINHSFWELGGNSLLLVKVYNQLQARTDINFPNLSIVDLFKYPTIAALAKHLKGKEQAARKIRNTNQEARLKQREIRQRYRGRET
jgi:amino acid adenylation domain-containing protein